MDRFQASNIANMKGLTALVTGGGTGIGLVIAKAFASNGAKVYITGRRVQVLEKTAADAQSAGLKLIPLQMDVTEKESIAKAVKAIESTEGKLDVLVNNAGILGPSIHLEDPKPTGKTYGDFLFNKETPDEWHKELATNTIAPFFVTMAFLGLLEQGAKHRPRGTSSVINISTMVAHTKLSLTWYAYGTTKAGIEHLTKVMATEFARREIPVRVNTLAPGQFASEVVGTQDEADKASQVPLPGALAPPPLKRAGREEEIAFAALYLASPGGAYSNGASLLADGGWSAVNL